MKQAKQGYILVLTLLLISISVILVTYMFNRGTVFVPFMRTMVEREKANVLALGGLQLAMSQLATQVKLQETKDGKLQKISDEQIAKELLQTILPSLNQWQSFDLKEEIDGIDATLKMCIMSEDGKLDINQLYDFQKKKFIGEGQPKGDMKKIAKQLFITIEKSTGGKSLFQGFEKFLKERQYNIQDATELLTIKEFDVFKNKVFYEPPSKGEAKKDSSKKRSLYLTDVFTVWSGKKTIQPWLFSDSMRGVLGIKKVESGDMKDRKNIIKKWLKEFKLSWQWPDGWKKIFSPIYSKDFKSFAQGIDSVLSTKFEPQIFSVLSYATVGKVTQRLFAVIERKKVSNDKTVTFDITLKKLYRI